MTDKLAYDCSFNHPKPAAARSAGYSAAIRYLSPDPAKNLTTDEAAALRIAGLGIGLIWESTAMRGLQGYAAGHADATAAARQLRALGAPPGVPVFANIGDWPVTAGQLNGIMAYYRGWRDALHEYRSGSGGYGPRFLIDRMVSSGHIGIWWQNAITTMGVSGGIVSPHASIYQRQHPTVTITGAKAGTWDEDAYGFGPVREIPWWQPAGKKPAPKPAPVTITQVQVHVTYSDGSTKTFPIA